MRRDASGLPFVCQPAWLKPSCRRLIGLAYGGHDVKGLENVPRSGPFIVAATHRSYFDPFLISAFLPRPLYFMAKRELFKNPLFGILLRTLGAFPVDRENARSKHLSYRVGPPEKRRRRGDFSRRGNRRRLRSKCLQGGSRDLGQSERRAHSPCRRLGFRQPAQPACRTFHPRLAGDSGRCHDSIIQGSQPRKP